MLRIAGRTMNPDAAHPSRRGEDVAPQDEEELKTLRVDAEAA
jgi:hypothetical protein